MNEVILSSQRPLPGPPPPSISSPFPPPPPPPAPPTRGEADNFRRGRACPYRICHLIRFHVLVTAPDMFASIISFVEDVRITTPYVFIFMKESPRVFVFYRVSLSFYLFYLNLSLFCFSQRPQKTTKAVGVERRRRKHPQFRHPPGTDPVLISLTQQSSPELP